MKMPPSLVLACNEDASIRFAFDVLLVKHWDLMHQLFSPKVILKPLANILINKKFNFEMNF